MIRTRIIGIIITLIVMLAIGQFVISCGDSSNGQTGKITAPSVAAIKSAISLTNPLGIIPGFELAAITIPECTTDETSPSITYQITGLPSWLSFNATTRELTLGEGLTKIPDDANITAELTYTCTLASSETAKAVDADTSSDSVSFVANDLDGGGVVDGLEYKFGEVPLVNNTIGWIWLNPSDVDLYRTPVSSPHKIPTGITDTQVGMDPTNAADEAEDFDGDGTSNGDEINNGTNLFVATSAGTFSGPDTYDTTEHEAIDGIAAADLNGDSFVDIITVEPSPSKISVFINKGDGTFESAAGYSGLSSNTGVVAADVDGDGDQDIIIMSPSSAQVRIMINDGDGILSAGETKSIAASAIQMASADFNGDGAVDIVVSRACNNNLSLLLGNGDGTFEDESLISAGQEQGGLAVADLDEDGNLDIAAASYTHIVFLMGKGDGTFDPATNMALSGSSVRIAFADLDDDGHLDIVTSDTAAAVIHVLLNDGTGSFTEKGTPSVLDNPYQIATADLNGDGVIDLAVACAGDGVTPDTDGIGILIGVGDGTFEPVENYDLAKILPATDRPAPKVILAADVDNDGDLDIATGPSVFTSYMNIFLNP